MTDNERAHAVRTLSAYPGFPLLRKLLMDSLARERDIYEGTDSTEHRRGRVTMLRDLCSEIQIPGV